MPTLDSILANMTPVVLSDLVEDVRIIDLLAALEDRTNLSPEERAQIIIGVFGARNLVVEDKEKRNSILLALKSEQRDDLANRLGIEARELETFRMSAQRAQALEAFFEIEPEPEEDEEDLLDRAWGLESESRLSCQVIVGKEDLEIEIPKYTINHARE